MLLNSTFKLPALTKARSVDPDACERAGMSPAIVRAFREGFDLNFVRPFQPVDPSTPSFYPSFLAHKEEGLRIVDDLVEKGYAVDLPLPPGRRPRFLNPWGLVPKSDGGWRPILDMTASGINAAMAKRDMALPTILDAVSMIGPGWWCVKHDLSNAFMHLPIRPDQAEVCAFERSNGRFATLMYCGFGGRVFPFLMEAVMVEVRKVLMARGVPPECLIYLDDTLICAPTMALAAHYSQIFLSTLAELGFKVNESKTVGPVQRIEFIGFIIDTVARTLCLSTKKCIRAQSRIRAVLDDSEAGPVDYKQFSQMVGYLVHVQTVVSWGRINLRPLWDVSATTLRRYKVGIDGRVKPPRGAQCHLPQDARLALDWWLKVLDENSPPTLPLFQLSTQGRLCVWSPEVFAALAPARPISSSVTLVAVDASYAGWGAVLGDPLCPSKRMAGLTVARQYLSMRTGFSRSLGCPPGSFNA